MEDQGYQPGDRVRLRPEFPELSEESGTILKSELSTLGTNFLPEQRVYTIQLDPENKDDKEVYIQRVVANCIISKV